MNVTNMRVDQPIGHRLSRVLSGTPAAIAIHLDLDRERSLDPIPIAHERLRLSSCFGNDLRGSHMLKPIGPPTRNRAPFRTRMLAPFQPTRNRPAPDPLQTDFENTNRPRDPVPPCAPCTYTRDLNQALLEYRSSVRLGSAVILRSSTMTSGARLDDLEPGRNSRDYASMIPVILAHFGAMIAVILW